MAWHIGDVHVPRWGGCLGIRTPIHFKEYSSCILRLCKDLSNSFLLNSSIRLGRVGKLVGSAVSVPFRTNSTKKCYYFPVLLILLHLLTHLSLLCFL